MKVASSKLGFKGGGSKVKNMLKLHDYNLGTVYTLIYALANIKYIQPIGSM